MAEPHKRPHRHPKYKTAYHVKNWRQYDKALRDRGDITLWISQDALDAWTPPQTGMRGAQPVYSDIAIETALTLRLLFHLPLRQTEGFLGAVLQFMDLTLPCPDHTTLSRRHPTVAIRQQVEQGPQGPLSVIVDSSGLKVCGQGEWHAQKHGEKKPKRWKKLHIGVDAQGQIVASAVTESSEHDPSQVPALLSQVEREIERFIGDGMYDQAPVYAAVGEHSPGARVIIPPRKDAVLSPTGATAPTQRDQHLVAIACAGRFAWKRTSGYYAQSHAENAFFPSSSSSAADYGRSGRHPRNGKPRWRARCSIGRRSWVVRNPFPSAESRVQGTSAASHRFVQQRHNAVTCIPAKNLVSLPSEVITMKTTVTARGQTVVPAKIRKAHQINAQTQLEWLDDGETIRVIPLPPDAIRAARGISTGLRQQLLAEREQERQRG